MYYQDRLSNGIKLLIVPAKNTKTATVLILLLAGSRYESLQLNGASHFIEHMMFKGTERRPNNLAIAKELDSVGAEYNAFTGKDHTGYWIKTIEEKMELSLDVLSDILFNSVFDKHEFRREKSVISEEIKMYQENPILYIGDFFDNILYRRHPLGRLISGSISTVKKMSRNDLLAYKRKFYQPSQMIIAVSGNVKKPEVINSVKKYFGGYKGKRVKNKYTPFKKSRTLINHKAGLLFKQTNQTQIALGGFAYPYNHPNIEILTLLLIILGGNMSSRLFTEIRVKKGLAYFIRAGSGVYQDIGSYVIGAGVDKEKTLEAVDLILRELRKIKKHGVTAEELKRAKDYFKGTLKLFLEDSANLIGWYAKQLLLTRKIISPEQKLRKVRKVTRNDVQKVANYIFARQDLNLALIGPFKNKKPFLQVLKKGV